MPKTNIPNYRHHKASGQAFVELGGRRFYLGKHGSKASREAYEQRIGEYLANGRKIAPTRTKTGISCKELAVHFLEWAERYYVKNGEPTATFVHCRNAVSLLVQHYGTESTGNFAPLSLVFLQEQWVEQGLSRPTVNRYVGVVKQAFRHGSKFGWVDPPTYYALLSVDGLKAGRTKAPEYKKIKLVADEIVEKTLPYLPPIVADMVQVQRRSGMRPQDVRNCRACDFDRSGDVWKYTPYTHKTEHQDKKRVVAIGPKAQAMQRNAGLVARSPSGKKSLVVSKTNVSADIPQSVRSFVQLLPLPTLTDIWHRVGCPTDVEPLRCTAIVWFRETLRKEKIALVGQKYCPEPVSLDGISRAALRKSSATTWSITLMSSTATTSETMK